MPFMGSPRAMGMLAAAIFLLLSACSTGSDPSESSLKAESQRRHAPDFALRDSQGKIVRLSDYKGKVVLLNFWATWCGPCKLEIPWFVEFERQHKDRGFAVLGISMDEDGWDVVMPFVSRIGINYRVLMGDDVVAQLYGGVDSLPTTFLIDREGRIARVHIGLVSRSSYERDLKELLQTSSGSAVDRARADAPALLASPK